LRDTYHDTNYAGDEGSTFPGWATTGDEAARAPQPGQGIGWDMSHGRRFVLLADTVSALGNAGIVTSAVSHADLLALGRQLVLGTWNGDKGTPLFTNFADETNGWYRVNYSNRAGYGIPPYGFSNRLVAAGFGYWGCYDEHIREVVLSRAAADESDPPSELSVSWGRVQWVASIRMAVCK